MRTINELVMEVSGGTKRVDDQVMVDRLYHAKCYWAGTIIRIDLKPVKLASSPQSYAPGVA